MIDRHAVPDHLIWATRGRAWGFRFLLDAGLGDPLAEYERAFAERSDGPSTWLRAVGRVALRFPDPLGRRDAAGRVIPHEFILIGELGSAIDSVEAGFREVWPVVAETYARFWDAERPPSEADVTATLLPERESGDSSPSVGPHS